MKILANLDYLPGNAGGGEGVYESSLKYLLANLIPSAVSGHKILVLFFVSIC